MPKFQIMRKISIDAAHRVPLHGSKCRAIHGHTYVVEAYCTGALIEEGPQTGMVLDFGFLKEGLMKFVDEPCDHGMILQVGDPLLDKLDPIAALDSRQALSDGCRFWLGSSDGLKLYVIPKVPTAENLAAHWYQQLFDFVFERSHGRAMLTKIRVHETRNCFADYPSAE